MSTMNISLPEEHITFVDQLIAKYGYASRSEFFRNLLRVLRHKPQIMEDAAVFPFPPTPPNQSIRDIMRGFRKTGKYSNSFLKSLEEGLKTSDYFRP